MCWFWHLTSQSHNCVSSRVLVSTRSESNTESSKEKWADFEERLSRLIMLKEVCWFQRTASRNQNRRSRAVLISTSSESKTESPDERPMVSTVSHLNSRYFQSHLTRRSMVSTSCCQNLSCLQKCADSSVQRVKATGFSIGVCWFRRAMSQSHNRISRCVLISTCSESYTESSRETCADFG